MCSMFKPDRSMTGRSTLSPYTVGPSIAVCILLTLSAHAFDFGDGESLLGPASLLPDWEETVQRAKKEHKLIEDCVEDEEACTRRMRPLRTLIRKGKDLSPHKQLSLVNRYINRNTRRYSRDRRTYKEYDDFRVAKRQQWSTLLEFLEQGGDCEDYATSKYALLRLLGFEADQLRVMVVYDKKAHEHHGLVVVHTEELGTRLLDSDNAIYRKRPFNYRYVYSINEESIWDHSLDRERMPRMLKLKKEEAASAD